MSSDEKALKPSERILELIAPLKRSDAGVDSHVIAAIIQYLDEQAELLDTHTVNEPDGLYCSYPFGHAGPCEKGKRDCQYDIDEEIYGKDTHTVKEEKEILLGEDKSDGVHVKLFGYRKDGVVYVTREEAGEGCSCTCQRCGKWFPCRKDSPMVEPIEHDCNKEDGKEDCKSCPTKDGIHLYPCKKKKEECIHGKDEECDKSCNKEEVKEEEKKFLLKGIFTPPDLPLDGKIEIVPKEEPTTPEIIITGLQYKVVSQPTTPEKKCDNSECFHQPQGGYERHCSYCIRLGRKCSC